MATSPEAVDQVTVAPIGGGTARPAIWRDRVVPALFAAGLGLVLLYGVGFAPTVELHNAAHDSRHSAAFPCH